MEKTKKVPLEINDKEFNKLLEKYGAKIMESFDINQNLKYSKEQKEILKKKIKNESELKKIK